ncbi:MAG: folate-binding protein [Litoreibacter sp.]
MSDRTVLSVTGADRESFLQGLVTNDVTKLKDGLVYAALLTAQGKFLIDFFLVPGGDAILIDVASDHAPSLFKKLTMYRLRADVQIADTDMQVSRGTGTPPRGSYVDPRHLALGWRGYGSEFSSDATDWDAIRVAHMVPELGHELVPDSSYILELDFERLNGIDFRKGCYVGQEINARMKHKTELRKGLARVSLSAPTPSGTEITAGGKSIGTVHTQSGDHALAYLRFDRAKGEMQAGIATVIRVE